MSGPDRDSAAERCALVIIDVQNDYFHSDGALARSGLDVDPLRRCVPAIGRLLAAAHAAAVPCVHVRTEHGPWFDDPAWTARGTGGTALDVERIPIAVAGTWGARPYLIEAGDDDLVLIKHRHSAFVHTPLELALRARRRDTVLFAGGTTNVCVRASATDALAQGFHPVLAADAVAAADRDQHATALREFAVYSGRVLDTARVIDAWQREGTYVDV